MPLPPARKWWPMSLRRESLPTRPCNTPTCRSRAPLRSKLWPGTGERPPRSPLRAPHGTGTTQQHLAHGTGGPEAETALRRPETDHFRRQGPAYLMELSRPKLSAAAKPSSYSSPTLQSVFARRCRRCETPEVHQGGPDDRHAEGHQAHPETVPPAHGRAERLGLLSAVAPAPARGAPAPVSRAGGSGGPGVLSQERPPPPDLHHRLGLKLLAGRSFTACSSLIHLSNHLILGFYFIFIM